MLTLPVLPTGLTADGFKTTESFYDSYGEYTPVNIMAMDYGGEFDKPE
jgi:hypothetical protein